MSNSPFAPMNAHITVDRPDGTTTFAPRVSPATQTVISSEMTYLYSSPPSFSLTESTDLNYHSSAPDSPPLRSFPPAGATILVSVDHPPNPNGDSTAGMHRTNTLDYCVVLEGEMELTLDSGEQRIVKKGEVVVQRGCWHSWKNVSATEWARLLCVAIGAEGAKEGQVEFPAKRG